MQGEKTGGYRTAEADPYTAVFHETCWIQLLSWTTHLRSLTIFEGFQVDGCWDLRQGHEAGAADSLGSWQQSLDLWVLLGHAV